MNDLGGCIGRVVGHRKTLTRVGFEPRPSDFDHRGSTDGASRPEREPMLRWEHLGVDIALQLTIYNY